MKGIKWTTLLYFVFFWYNTLFLVLPKYPVRYLAVSKSETCSRMFYWKHLSWEKLRQRLNSLMICCTFKIWVSPSSADHLTAMCNVECACVNAPYSPVCGADGTVYYSACHAGCTTRTLAGSAQLFHQCSCILTKENTTLPVYDIEGGKCYNDLCGVWCVFLSTAKPCGMGCRMNEDPDCCLVFE